MKRVLLTALLLVGLAGQAQAGETREDPTEARVRGIAKELRCAVCQNQSIYESNADLAKDMLKIVREQVGSGADDATIRSYFLERYGDYIYLEPRKSGANWIIWVGPFVLLGLGAWGLMASLKAWSGRKEQARQATPLPADAQALHARIQKEMDRYDL